MIVGHYTIFVARKIVSTKAGIDGPKKPDPKQPITGGRKKLRWFAYHLDSGLAPYDAYLKAGFPVLGVKGPSGQVWTEGLIPSQAQDKAEHLAASTQIQGWIASWNIPTEHLLEQMKADSAFVLKEALKAKDKNGNPSSTAINAADSILDRTGLGRGSKIDHSHRNSKTQNIELEDLKRQVLEAMRRDGTLIDGVVERQPALTDTANAIDVEVVPAE